jgi:hypothetical protein
MLSQIKCQLSMTLKLGQTVKSLKPKTILGFLKAVKLEVVYQFGFFSQKILLRQGLVKVRPVAQLKKKVLVSILYTKMLSVLNIYVF